MRKIYTREFIIESCIKKELQIFMPDESVRCNRRLCIDLICKEEDCKQRIYNKCVRDIIEFDRYYCEQCSKEYTIEKFIEFSNNEGIQVVSDPHIKFNREKIIIGICKTNGCNDTFERSVRILMDGSRMFYCKRHTNDMTQTKRTETCIIKYGCEHPLQNEEVKEKIKATNIERYGCENPFQNEEVKEKIKATSIERYGFENPSQNKEVKEKIKATNIERYGCENPFQNEEVKEKIKATSIERYGFEYPMQHERVQEKGKSTNIKRYGVENPFQNEGCKTQSKITMMEHYGVSNPMYSELLKERQRETLMKNYGVSTPMHSDVLKERSRITCMERYGYENPMHNSEVAERASKNAYKSYPYTLPSGSTIQLQGYERYAMNILLKSYDETEIITDRTQVPELWYDDSDGVQHRYYVDIFLPDENKMIEVKSTWTYEKDEEKVTITKEVAQNLGMMFECWIMNDKGEIIDIK